MSDLQAEKLLEAASPEDGPVGRSRGTSEYTTAHVSRECLSVSLHGPAGLDTVRIFLSARAERLPLRAALLAMIRRACRPTERERVSNFRQSACYHDQCADLSRLQRDVALLPEVAAAVTQVLTRRSATRRRCTRSASRPRPTSTTPAGGRRAHRRRRQRGRLHRRAAPRPTTSRSAAPPRRSSPPDGAISSPQPSSTRPS